MFQLSLLIYYINNYRKSKKTYILLYTTRLNNTYLYISTYIILTTSINADYIYIYNKKRTKICSWKSFDHFKTLSVKYLKLKIIFKKKYLYTMSTRFGFNVNEFNRIVLMNIFIWDSKFYVINNNKHIIESIYYI